MRHEAKALPTPPLPGLDRGLVTEARCSTVGEGPSQRTRLYVASPESWSTVLM